MWIFSVASVAAADDFDYVKEVLEEDREHYGDQESYMHDYANTERNEEMKRETEQERIVKEEADRVRAEQNSRPVGRSQIRDQSGAAHFETGWSRHPRRTV